MLSELIILILIGINIGAALDMVVSINIHRFQMQLKIIDSFLEDIYINVYNYRIFVLTLYHILLRRQGFTDPRFTDLPTHGPGENRATTQLRQTCLDRIYIYIVYPWWISFRLGF